MAAHTYAYDALECAFSFADALATLAHNAACNTNETPAFCVSFAAAISRGSIHPEYARSFNEQFP
jgi:hypothetical protein